MYHVKKEGFNILKNLFVTVKIKSRIENNVFFICNCKAYDASSRELIKDFGVVSSCKGWPKCACRRAEMMNCADTCDHVVAQWVCNHQSECEARSDRIKKYYDAGGCSRGFGHESRKCGDCSTLG